MKQLIATLIIPIAIMALAAVGSLGLGVETALALDPGDGVNRGINAAGGGSGSGGNLSRAIKNVINVLLFILGAIAVIMIVIGGIKYTISNGDASNIKSAKDTILYAVIGLIIALMAYAIVNFVVGAFS